MYERSRRECEEELIKRKNELEYERANMIKIKEKELNTALDKFNNDFEEIRKQIVNMINQQLTETKARMIAEIKEKKSADTNDEVYLKKQIEDTLNRINTNLMGLRQSTSPPRCRSVPRVYRQDCHYRFRHRQGGGQTKYQEDAVPSAHHCSRRESLQLL